jgi:DcuC family C4-dicarboxylate transporter
MTFLISLTFIVCTALLLARKANAQSVLMLAGILMWIAAFAIHGREDLQPTPSSNSILLGLKSLLGHIKSAFSETMGGLGLMIMVIGGFVKCMDYCGASRRLVDSALTLLKPFQRNPYLLASITIPVGQVLFMAIPSAAGFALLWMSAVFPILIRMGVSPLSAASVITATTAFGVGPACATTASAMSVLSLEAVPYFVRDQLPLVWPLSICMATVFYFTNRHADRSVELNRSTNIDLENGIEEKMEDHLVAVGDQKNGVHAPKVYALLPLLPIGLLLILSPWINPWARESHIDTTEVMLLSFLITLICESLVRRNFKTMLANINVFWKGMTEMLLGVVSLVIAADLFAEGLIALGFIDDLVRTGATIGLQAGGIGALLTLFIFGAAALMGSGNAAFFAFGPMVPGFASGLSCSGTFLLLPMQLAASMGRTISPVSGVLIAVASPARIDPLTLAKRNLLPVSASLALMMIIHFIF